MGIQQQQQQQLQHLQASTNNKKKQKAPKAASKGTSQKVAVSSQNAPPAMEPNFSTPCRMIAALELKPKNKQPKLLSSKSLSQLVPRGLFFKRHQQAPANKHSAADGQQNHGGKSGAAKEDSNSGCKLTTTKSFPTAVFHSTGYDQRDLMENGPQEFVNRVDSDSLIGWARQSLSGGGFFGNTNNSTLEQPNISPIVGSVGVGGRDQANEVFSLSPASVEVSSNESVRQSEGEKTTGSGAEPEEATAATATKKATGKFKPFKGTTLVLRDVKNSIGLRIRAKHESQAFAKLTEELATPPTKLYSPFNIYTPDNSTKDSKSKRKLNLNKNKPTVDNRKQAIGENDDHNGDCSLMTDEGETPKRRIALQHKKHLMQANKFTTFISPTGKFRETVKDVEHFQQCIEDISKAIRARDNKSR